MQTNNSTSYPVDRRPLRDRPYACRKCLDTGIVLCDGERRYCRCEAGKRLYADRCREYGDES